MEERNLRKVMIGTVLSNKMDKTVVVAVQRNVSQIGDKVKVMETRPLSKDKRWRVVEVVEKAIIK